MTFRDLPEHILPTGLQVLKRKYRTMCKPQKYITKMMIYNKYINKTQDGTLKAFTVSSRDSKTCLSGTYNVLSNWLG